MITFYWISIAVFWVIGLVVWNKLYPKNEQ
jgi:hypothetical protein